MAASHRDTGQNVLNGGTSRATQTDKSIKIGTCTRTARLATPSTSPLDHGRLYWILGGFSDRRREEGSATNPCLNILPSRESNLTLCFVQKGTSFPNSAGALVDSMGLIGTRCAWTSVDQYRRTTQFGSTGGLQDV